MLTWYDPNSTIPAISKDPISNPLMDAPFSSDPIQSARKNQMTETLTMPPMLLEAGQKCLWTVQVMWAYIPLSPLIHLQTFIVELFFSPGEKGVFNSNLLFEADDASVSIGFNGIGVQGPQDISPNPSELDFGHTTVHGTPRLLQLDLYNFGTVDLSISGMALSNQDQFILDVDGGTKPCASRSPVLPKGDHCTIEVYFSRETVGEFDATLDIDSDDPNQSTASLPLTAVVSEPITPDSTGSSSGGGCFIFELISALFKI